MYLSSLFLYCSAPPRHLHSFPTRRSSDLVLRQRADRPGRPHRVDADPLPGRVVHRDLEVGRCLDQDRRGGEQGDRKSTRLNSSHMSISYAVFCLKKKKKKQKKKLKLSNNE